MVAAACAEQEAWISQAKMTFRQAFCVVAVPAGSVAVASVCDAVGDAKREFFFVASLSQSILAHFGESGDNGAVLSAHALRLLRR